MLVIAISTYAQLSVADRSQNTRTGTKAGDQKKAKAAAYLFELFLPPRG